jgi:hypothetical protein
MIWLGRSGAYAPGMRSPDQLPLREEQCFIRIWIKTGAVFEAIGGPLKAAVVTQMFIQQSVKFASKMCYCWGTAQFGAVC